MIKRAGYIAAVLSLTVCVVLDFAQRIPNGHIAGPSAVAKLWIPYILPPWVIKTIVIDSDMFWNENALMLWKIFEQFKSTQMIGLAWEQQSYDPLCIEDPAKLLPRRGVNGGLVLMHLERMRNIRWDITIEQIIHQRLNQVGILGEGEQEVYSFLIHLKPDWYYGIPCEWNIQVYAAVAVRCCPIIWPDRRPDVSQKCFDVADNKSFGFGSLVHYDTPLKPEESGWENSVPVSTPRPGDVLTIDELRSRFLDLYARFQRIPMECFA
ncbi:LARGE xylosyl- and glucuronyltransferase 2 [Clonorchis sinensis]|uniref:LARGE xylosyl- and glucuronyltransferase 2 n=1 Tax=Clonorchis sinensis TaxID=79923 RepID=A0A8T1MZ64_CLOSI|nr:LARGE xylosyl- and glucuronyltransferase 2 [Clonorchis sinensis]